MDNRYERPKTSVQSMTEGVGDRAGMANGDGKEHGVLRDIVAAVGPLTAARAAVAAANAAMEAVGEQREREPPARELTPPSELELRVETEGEKVWSWRRMEP